jgi:hypothetical protein
MLPLRFTYLFGSSLFLIPWLLIFFARKDLRRLMIINGLLASVLGLIFQYFFWTKDWWHPYTITGTRVGIEDILHGFLGGGVGACLYFYIFNKKLKTLSLLSSRRLTLLVILVFASFILVSFLVQFLRLSSFTATAMAGVGASFVFAFSNKKLIKNSIINGALMVVLVIPIYLLMMHVTPNFIDKTWVTENLIGLRFLGVPLEDYVYYFIIGTGSFLIYPFLFGYRMLSGDS